MSFLLSRTRVNYATIVPTLPKGEHLDILLAIHSILRWIIIIVAALAIIRFTLGWAGNGLFSRMDRGLASGYSGLMDLQMLIGLVYFIWNGIEVTGFPLYRILHLGAMFIAVALGHLPARFKSLNDKLRFQYSVFALVASLIMIGVGISFLPGGLGR